MVDKELRMFVDKICRSCMNENENMHNLFENKPDIEGSSSVLLSEMLIACASVEVLFGDGLPYNLCDPCKDKLLNAYEFRLQCQRSHSTLRKLNNAESKDSVMKEQNILDQPDDIFEEEDERPPSERILKQQTPKKNDGGFPCNFCHKVLRTNRGLQGHLEVHTGEKTSRCTDPFILRNNFCDQRGLTSESIENYIKQEKEEVEVKLEVVSPEDVDMETFKEYNDNLINDNFHNNFRLNEDNNTNSTQDALLPVKVCPPISGPSTARIKHKISLISSKCTDKGKSQRVMRKRCRMCTKTGRGRKQTIYHCADCDNKPGLCVECFNDYHDSLDASQFPGASQGGTRYPCP